MADDWNAKVIEEFRANGGKVGGVFEGAPLLLLHTTGARSGEARVHPMMYQQLDEGLAVFASAAGADKHPDWHHNLVANPGVQVEVGTETFDGVARVTAGDERDEIWTRQKAAYSGFAEYEAKTSREIPVIVLIRA